MNLWIKQPKLKSDHYLTKIFKQIVSKAGYPPTLKKDTDLGTELKYVVNDFLQILAENKSKHKFCLKLYSAKNDYIKIGDNLANIINEYINGNSHLAYEALNETMKLPIVSEYINKLTISLNSDDKNKAYLYRTRIDDGTINKLDDIFHIPFYQRHRVKSQRYSIAGVPSLYLCSSIFNCWLEMGRPDLNSLFISCFTPSLNKNLNILDLNANLLTYLSNVENQEDLSEADYEFIEASFAMWPITMSCSYQCANKGADFNIEYIIPNMMLQWIKNSRVLDGVRYSSSNYNFGNHPEIGYNFVFPTRQLSKNFCLKLSDCFEFTKPTSWQILRILVANLFLVGVIKDDIFETFEDQLLNEYLYTPFGRIETLLKDKNDRFKKIQPTFTADFLFEYS